MLKQVLQTISNNYLGAKTGRMEANSLANYIRTDARREIKNVVGEYNKNLVVDASSGKSKWADIPWIAVFDPLVTDSVQHGYYIVYLFSADMTSVYLCLAQGITTLNDEFSKKERKNILLQRSNIIRSRIPEYAKKFSSQQIHLRSNSDRPKAYEHSCAFHAEYSCANIPSEETLKNDLLDMVGLYETLIYRGGTDLTDEKITEDETGDDFSAEEKKLYRIHKMTERKGYVAKKVKDYHKYACQACEFDFEKTYGEVGKHYIEAHHLVPFADLKPGQTRRLDIRTDFAVLCSNCHRMMHRSSGPKTIQELQKLLQLKNYKQTNEKIQ